MFVIICKKCGKEQVLEDNKFPQDIELHPVQESVAIYCQNPNCNNEIYV